MVSIKWLKGYFFPSQQKGLLYQLVKREIKQKFQGSWLGLGWAILTPIAMLGVYTFVFRSVLKAKWPGSATDSDAEFALQLFSGLLVFTLFSEVIGRAPTLISDQPNMVKKVIFPLPILPWVSVSASAFFALLSLLVLIAASWITRGELTIHLAALPLIVIAFAPILLGLSWLLSSLGVYLRDLGHIVGLILTPLMFLSPIFYPITALPDLVQELMIWNPLALIIDSVRLVVLHAEWPNFYALGLYLMFSITIAVMGAACFHKTRKGFADVL
ncbi:ABC transporter permease [Alkalimarinus alittae]|uniref:Transport permease protein n=1 Tax=Alkalimarinus alittae TaxID=2961619 RepID=A0ABY6MZ70_9ALTE|nr:ABC transporter permease [Alkalimarinus alittae]UZE95131.1 ABC transporter permease [Alkalimarinus alittae]